jgi:transcriptional regulator GlxA family with amidase domain
MFSTTILTVCSQKRSQETMQSNNSHKRTIAFVLYDGLTPLDLVGPAQVLSALPGLDPRYEVVVVSERIEPMSSDTPLTLTPSHTFDQVQDPYVVIVPGGGIPTLKAMANEAIRTYLHGPGKRAEIVASVCTGALILAAAGFLPDRPATTHWAYRGLLEQLGARYQRQRWVEDGKVITAAGVSAGIDMAIYLAARLSDERTARFLQLGIEYHPEPPFGGIDWSIAPMDIAIERLGPRLPEFQEAFADRPDLSRAVETWLGADVKA